jgi:hypothetical protein
MLTLKRENLIFQNFRVCPSRELNAPQKLSDSSPQFPALEIGLTFLKLKTEG